MRIKTFSALLIAIGQLLGGLVAQGAESLSRPDQLAYQPLKFDRSELGPPGWRLKPVPRDWYVLSLDGAWKFKELPLGTNAKDPFKNPLDDVGMKQGFFRRDFDDSGWSRFPVPWSWWRKPDGSRAP